MASSDILSRRLSRSTSISWWPRCSWHRSFQAFFAANSKNITKSPDYALLDDWLRTGLLTRFVSSLHLSVILSNIADGSSSGKKWKTHRRIITPSFHDNNLLANCIDTFNEQLQACLRRFHTLADEGTEVNLYRWISAWTLDVICGQSFWRAATISARPSISARSRDSHGKEHWRAGKRIGIWQCRSPVGSSLWNRMRQHLIVE